jgi:hypothetical protein
VVSGHNTLDLLALKDRDSLRLRLVSSLTHSSQESLKDGMRARSGCLLSWWRISLRAPSRRSPLLRPATNRNPCHGLGLTADWGWMSRGLDRS